MMNTTPPAAPAMIGTIGILDDEEEESNVWLDGDNKRPWVVVVVVVVVLGWALVKKSAGVAELGAVSVDEVGAYVSVVDVSGLLSVWVLGAEEAAAKLTIVAAVVLTLPDIISVNMVVVVVVEAVVVNVVVE
jgi:hypothetical protein